MPNDNIKKENNMKRIQKLLVALLLLPFLLLAQLGKLVLIMES